MWSKTDVVESEMCIIFQKSRQRKRSGSRKIMSVLF